MTVTGIWDWAVGKSSNVSIESLRDKTLAIDGHIWLYESLKGCKNHHQSGASYLVTIYKRCRYLLDYKIRPIVVFDTIIALNPTLSRTNQEEFSLRKRRRSGGNDSFTNFADEVYKCQVMLRNVGVTVIIANGDGEAQCAKLEEAGFVDGCITNDFDYFLFGGRNMYRMNFEANGSVSKDIMYLQMSDIEKEPGASRNGIIALAILLGCDYYERGVRGIGVVTGFDILSEFSKFEDDDPVVILDRFTSYARAEIPERPDDSETKLRLRKRTYLFSDDFPNCDSVFEAVNIYMRPRNLGLDKMPPAPDENHEKLERILVKECGWTIDRVQKEARISERRQKRNGEIASQPRISDYFMPQKRKLKPVVQFDVDADSMNNNKKKKSLENTKKPRRRTVKSCRITANPRCASDEIVMVSSDDDLSIIQID